MNFEACFRLLAERLKDEIIVTSAGNSSELWWDITHETERVFYLEASMSLCLGVRRRHRTWHRAHGGRIQRRRCLLHEPRHAAGGAPTGAAQSQTLRDLEPGLRFVFRPLRPLPRSHLFPYKTQAVRQ